MQVICLPWTSAAVALMGQQHRQMTCCDWRAMRRLLGVQLCCTRTQTTVDSRRATQVLALRVVCLALPVWVRTSAMSHMVQTTRVLPLARTQHRRWWLSSRARLIVRHCMAVQMPVHELYIVLRRRGTEAKCTLSMLVVVVRVCSRKWRVSRVVAMPCMCTPLVTCRRCRDPLQAATLIPAAHLRDMASLQAARVTLETLEMHRVGLPARVLTMWTSKWTSQMGSGLSLGVLSYCMSVADGGDGPDLLVVWFQWSPRARRCPRVGQQCRGPPDHPRRRHPRHGLCARGGRLW